MNETFNENLAEQLEEWLTEQGRSAKDIMEKDGEFYVLVDNSEDEREEFRKEFVPAKFKEIL